MALPLSWRRPIGCQIGSKSWCDVVTDSISRRGPASFRHARDITEIVEERPFPGSFLEEIGVKGEAAVGIEDFHWVNRRAFRGGAAFGYLFFTALESLLGHHGAELANHGFGRFLVLLALFIGEQNGRLGR